jgi:ABC-type multidrug transport system permease subunit
MPAAKVAGIRFCASLVTYWRLMNLSGNSLLLRKARTSIRLRASLSRTLLLALFILSVAGSFRSISIIVASSDRSEKGVPAVISIIVVCTPTRVYACGKSRTLIDAGVTLILGGTYAVPISVFCRLIASIVLSVCIRDAVIVGVQTCVMAWIVGMNGTVGNCGSCRYHSHQNH